MQRLFNADSMNPLPHTGASFSISKKTVLATALAIACTVSLPPARAARVEVPPVPAGLEVPEGHRVFFVGHAVGTQNYICLPCPNAVTPLTQCPTAGVAGYFWTLFTPQATLFNDDDRQLTTHFFSSNPFENDAIRPTWQHSRDTSAVWAGQAVASADPYYVEPGSIPWLRLTVLGAQDGPDSGDRLTKTTFIQRLNTSGGVVPATGCSTFMDAGARQSVPYTADYFFYKNAAGGR